MLPADDEATLARRGSRRWSTGCCRGRSRCAAGRRAERRRSAGVTVDRESSPPRDPGAAPGAPLGVATRPAWSSSARGLVALGFELVSTGGTARALREAGLPVTDVAAVTGLPGDARRAGEDAPSADPRRASSPTAGCRTIARSSRPPAIEPFELVVVNLYPFAAAARRPGITFDELIEEIDIGGPTLVRAAAKNHANVAIVTRPRRYEARPRGAATSRTVSPGLLRARSRSRRSATPPRTTRGSRPSCRPDGGRRRRAARRTRPAGARPVSAT